MSEPVTSEGAAGNVEQKVDATGASKAAGATFVTGAAEQKVEAKPDAKAENGTGDKGTEQKTEPKEAPAAEFELKAPEGSDLDKGQLDGFKAFAKEQKLTGAQAQGAVEWFAKSQAAAAKAFEERVAQQDKANLEAITKDKELGGANLEKTRLFVQKAAAKYFPPGSVVADMLDQTKLGNHPEWVRVFAAIGRDMAEDTAARGGAKTRAPKSLGEVLHPTMHQQKER